MAKDRYIALGLMSGTSVDGVDAAFLETDGERIYKFGPHVMVPYAPEDRDTLMQATQAALRWRFQGARPNSLYAAETIVHKMHRAAIKAVEKFDGAEALSLIGFHGQTVLHHPASAGVAGQTLQLGDGQILANEFGVPVAYDFRSKDVAAGGQGAPLAPIYHKALVEHAGLSGTTAVLNLGGVGNVTLIGPNLLAATDTGPANGPLDSWLEKHGHDYDDRGQISAKGEIDFERVDAWLTRDFFSRSVPRSADRYDFDVMSEMEHMSLEDGAATLCAFTALSVKRSLSQLGRRPDRVIVCGGGRHNRTIMTLLSVEIGCPVWPAERVGWNADMIEAQAFAFLAVRTLRGLPISFPETTGVPKPMTGGQVAHPLSPSCIV